MRNANKSSSPEVVWRKKKKPLLGKQVLLFGPAGTDAQAVCSCGILICQC